MRRFRRCRAGTSAIEFAVIAPLLCLLLLAVIHFALLLGTAHSLAQIAADVSRYAMVGHDWDERRSLAMRWMERSASSYALVDARRLRLTTTEDDDLMTVSLAYDISYLPVPPLLAQMVDLPPIIVSSAAVRLP